MGVIMIKMLDVIPGRRVGIRHHQLFVRRVGILERKGNTTQGEGGEPGKRVFVGSRGRNSRHEGFPKVSPQPEEL